MEYSWKKTCSKGAGLETGIFAGYETTDSKIPTLMYIHCSKFPNEKMKIYSRVYFKAKKEEITDGFFHWISDDVGELVAKSVGFKLDADQYMNADYYCGISHFPRNVPYSLGDYSFESK